MWRRIALDVDGSNARSDMEQNEYERGAMGAKHTASQRAAFDDIVAAWADGSVSLAESAAALRAKIAKLPAKAEPASRRAKSHVAAPAVVDTPAAPEPDA